MQIFLLINLFIYYSYAEKKETKGEALSPDPPDRKENSAPRKIMKDYQVSYDQGIPLTFPIVSKIATKTGQVSGASSSGSFGRMNSAKTGGYNLQFKSLLDKTSPRNIRHKKQQNINVDKKHKKASSDAGVVKGYFSSAYQQGYSGRPDAQVHAMKKGFRGAITRGFRGGMSRAGYMSSKSGYGTLYENQYFSSMMLPGTLPPTNSIIHLQASTPPTFIPDGGMNFGANSLFSSNNNIGGNRINNNQGFASNNGYNNMNYVTETVDWEEIARKWKASSGNNHMNTFSSGAGNSNGNFFAFTTSSPISSGDSSFMHGFNGNNVGFNNFNGVNSRGNWRSNSNGMNMNTFNNAFNGNGQNLWSMGNTNMNTMNTNLGATRFGNTNFGANGNHGALLPTPIATNGFNSFNSFSGQHNFNGNTKTGLPTHFSSYKSKANNKLINPSEVINIPGAVDASLYSTNHERKGDSFMNSNQGNTFAQNTFTEQSNRFSGPGFESNGNTQNGLATSYQTMNNGMNERSSNNGMNGFNTENSFHNNLNMGQNEGGNNNFTPQNNFGQTNIEHQPTFGSTNTGPNAYKHGTNVYSSYTNNNEQFSQRSNQINSNGYGSSNGNMFAPK